MKKLFFILAVTCFAVLSPDAQSAEQDAEIVKLLRQISEKLTGIDKRLQKLEKKQTKKTPVTRVVGNGKNTDKLSKIKFPSNPTKENLKKYVRKILFATRGQNSYSSRDMQVEMLERVGHANLDILILALKGKFGARVPGVHLEYAVKNLVKPSDKELIIKALPNNTSLVDIIIRYGWEKDVRKILIDKLYSSSYLPSSWIAAVASFKDPKTYGMLKEYFITNRNRLSTYEAIKDLPGLKLDDSVDEAWSMAESSQHNEWEMFGMSLIAVKYGKKEALDHLIDNFNDQKFSYHRMKSVKTIRDHVDFDGSLYDLGKWYKKNKKDIVFDKTDQKFKLESKVAGSKGGK